LYWEFSFFDINNISVFHYYRACVDLYIENTAS